MKKLGEFTEAAILVEQNKDLIIDKIKLPESLGIGQVFVVPKLVRLLERKDLILFYLTY